MKTMLLNFRKSFVYAMAIFAGVVLATTSCNPFGKDLGDGDGDGDGYVDNYSWSTDVKESANQIVFTVDFNSGFSGNTIYNSSFTMVYTFTFRNDICIGAINETTFVSQVYADAYYSDSGEGTKSGKTITIDLTDDFADMTKTEVRQIIQVMESQYNNSNNNNN